MDCINHWIPAFAGMTEGVLLQTLLYHGSAELAERPASMQACP